MPSTLRRRMHIRNVFLNSRTQRQQCKTAWTPPYRKKDKCSASSFASICRIRCTMFTGLQLKLLLVCTQLEHQKVLSSAAAEELRAQEAVLRDILDDQQPKARSA